MHNKCESLGTTSDQQRHLPCDLRPRRVFSAWHHQLCPLQARCSPVGSHTRLSSQYHKPCKHAVGRGQLFASAAGHQSVSNERSPWVQEARSGRQNQTSAGKACNSSAVLRQEVIRLRRSIFHMSSHPATSGCDGAKHMVQVLLATIMARNHDSTLRNKSATLMPAKTESNYLPRNPKKAIFRLANSATPKLAKHEKLLWECWPGLPRGRTASLVKHLEHRSLRKTGKTPRRPKAGKPTSLPNRGFRKSRAASERSHLVAGTKAAALSIHT